MKSLDIEQFIRKYLDHYHNYKSSWNYEDGCVLSGCIQLFGATGDEYYKDFVLHYMEDFIEPDGSIRTFEKEKYNIDNINPGKALFFLYEKTGEDKYRRAINTVYDQLRTHPRTQCGSFWHKKIYPNQIWLDGLYMAQPFYMAYETKFNSQKGYGDIVNQFVNVKKYLYNENKGLYYHAYDEAGLQKWADKITGQSPNFWLRSIGWYLMALIDTIEEIDKESLAHFQTLTDIFREAVDGVLNYQDEESKLFYQIVDKADIEGNYLETSGTAMIAYSIMKGCGLGVLPQEEYQKTGEEIFNHLAEQKLIDKDGDLHLCGICSVAGLGPGEERDGSIAYYLSEKVVCDDPKGVGAFMMAYAQIKNLSNLKK
jgi:unsaturated rhamnogalacturonyl hydrolase